MQLARVIGHAVATAKHGTMEGRRIAVVQALDPRDKPDGDPFLVVDDLGVGVGSVAIITSDGKAAQTALGKTTPVRFMVIGLADE